MKLHAFVHDQPVATLDSTDGFRHVMAHHPDAAPEQFASLPMPVRTESCAWAALRWRSLASAHDPAPSRHHGAPRRRQHRFRQHHLPARAAHPLLVRRLAILTPLHQHRAHVFP